MRKAPRRSRSPLRVSASASGGDAFLRGLDVGVLETQQLGNPAGEVALDLGQRAVGIDDAPDRLDQPQALIAREVLAKELCELEEIHALAPLLLSQSEDLVDFASGDVHFLADVPLDSFPLLVPENIVRMRDLEQKSACRYGDGVGSVLGLFRMPLSE